MEFYSSTYIHVLFFWVPLAKANSRKTGTVIRNLVEDSDSFQESGWRVAYSNMGQLAPPEPRDSKLETPGRAQGFGLRV